MSSCLISMSHFAAIVRWTRRDVRVTTREVVFVKSTLGLSVNPWTMYLACDAGWFLLHWSLLSNTTYHWPQFCWVVVAQVPKCCSKQGIGTSSSLYLASALTQRLLLPLMAPFCFQFGLPMSTCACNKQVVVKGACLVTLHAPQETLCLAGSMWTHCRLWIAGFLVCANHLPIAPNSPW